MSKEQKKIGNNQLDLFNFIKNKRPKSLRIGSLNIHTKLCNLITEEIRLSGLTRYQVAAIMSELLDQEVTKTMIDSYTADSKDRHRFPAEFIPAFKEAVNSYASLDLIVRESGRNLMPDNDVVRAGIQKIEEEIKILQAEKEEMLLWLKIGNNK